MGHARTSGFWPEPQPSDRVAGEVMVFYAVSSSVREGGGTPLYPRPHRWACPHMGRGLSMQSALGGFQVL